MYLKKIFNRIPQKSSYFCVVHFNKPICLFEY